MVNLLLAITFAKRYH